MFRGSIVALVTPMDSESNVDYEALDRLIDFHLKQKTDGLVLLGSTGEAATVTPEERKRIIEFVIKKVNNRLPIMVGTGSNNLHATVEMSRQAMQLGARAALIVTPYYNRPTQAGLIQYYQAISDAIPMPICLYNVPSRTGCDLLPDTVEKLSDLTNIVALKEANATPERMQALSSLSDHLDIFSGDDAATLPFMKHGAKGVISVIANIAPNAMHKLCAAALSREEDVANTLNQSLSALYDLMGVESNPIPVKWALYEMGLIDQGIRLPLTPLSVQYRCDLKDQLIQSKLLHSKRKS